MRLAYPPWLLHRSRCDRIRTCIPQFLRLVALPFSNYAPVEGSTLSRHPQPSPLSGSHGTQESNPARSQFWRLLLPMECSACRRRLAPRALTPAWGPRFRGAAHVSVPLPRFELGRPGFEPGPLPVGVEGRLRSGPDGDPRYSLQRYTEASLRRLKNIVQATPCTDLKSWGG